MGSFVGVVTLTVTGKVWVEAVDEQDATAKLAAMALPELLRSTSLKETGQWSLVSASVDAMVSDTDFVD